MGDELCGASALRVAVYVVIIMLVLHFLLKQAWNKWYMTAIRKVSPAASTASPAAGSCSPCAAAASAAAAPSTDSFTTKKKLTDPSSQLTLGDDEHFGDHHKYEKFTLDGNENVSYSDYIMGIGVDKAAIENHKQFVKDTEQLSGGSSRNTVFEPTDLVPFVGLRRPQYTAVGEDEGNLGSISSVSADKLPWRNTSFRL